MQLIHEENRIYGNNADGKLVAEITFPEISDGIVVIDHTFVDNSLRGQGVAGQLVQAAAEDLRSSGRKARLTCSYAVTWFSRHPEYQELLLAEEDED